MKDYFEVTEAEGFKKGMRVHVKRGRPIGPSIFTIGKVIQYRDGPKRVIAADGGWFSPSELEAMK